MPLDTSRLAIDVQEGEGWRRTVSVTVPADLVAEERKRLARSLATRARIPGFRPGRIPPAVIEKHYGPSLDREMVDSVMNDAYKSVLESRALRPISDGQLEDIQYAPASDLSFRISFEIEPEIELSRLAGFKVERPSDAVGADEVDKVLERLRDQNATFEPVDGGRPETGDLVAITVTRLDGEDAADAEPRDYDLLLGQGDAIPDVENAILTLDVGGEGEFEVVFPDDFPNEERRGQRERLRIGVRERKQKRLPELDDAFARSLGDFDSLDALRARILEDLQKEAGDRAESAVRSQLLDAIVDANPFTVPAVMVDRYLDSVLGEAKGLPAEQLAELRERLRPEAEGSVKRYLVIERVATLHQLKATEDEIDDRVQEIADRGGSNASDVYARLQKAGRLEQLEREITERKVFDHLKSQSTITQA